ncbi:hypothetical protein GCM10028777_19560 [Angustibacter speluncae]
MNATGRAGCGVSRPAWRVVRRVVGEVLGDPAADEATPGGNGGVPPGVKALDGGGERAQRV